VVLGAPVVPDRRRKGLVDPVVLGAPVVPDRRRKGLVDPVVLVYLLVQQVQQDLANLVHQVELVVLVDLVDPLVLVDLGVLVDPEDRRKGPVDLVDPVAQEDRRMGPAALGVLADPRGPVALATRMFVTPVNPARPENHSNR
jgi:hypothetical protein